MKTLSGINDVIYPTPKIALEHFCKYNNIELIDTIIHETLHAVIYEKTDLDDYYHEYIVNIITEFFNENRY